MTTANSHLKARPKSALRSLVAVSVAVLSLGSCSSSEIGERQRFVAEPGDGRAPAELAPTADDRSSRGVPGTAPSPAVIDEPPDKDQRSGTVAGQGAPAFPTGITPTRLEIPTIGVDAPTVDLDLRGPEPEVPTDFENTGWYQQTRLPGEIGPAVIAGHIDNISGPAVFARLDELEPGDEIIVHDDDGGRRVFVVDRAGQYPKAALPSEVFGFDLPVPELRLITCGGTFDRSSGHYRDNYVVYAIPADHEKMTSQTASGDH